MAIEPITYISDLVVTNPPSTDVVREGADHIKGTKGALKNSFPNITGPVNSTQAELNLLVGMTSVLSGTSPGVWTLQRDLTVSGSPAAIDFVNGSSGVVISSAYDAYLIEYSNLKSSGGTGVLRIQVSENAGVTFPANATGCSSQTEQNGSFGNTTGSPFAVVSPIATAATDPGVSGWVVVWRPLNGTKWHQFWAQQMADVTTMVRSAGVLQTTTNQFDALRLLFSVGTFAGSNARIRFSARRA